ncbi:hypothetical protein ACVVIH_13065 [Chryseobacterium arthrosphaerae]
MLFTTIIRAIDPITGELKKWCGPYIEAISLENAKQYCRENLGYCEVDSELVAEIPCKEGSYKPDFCKMVDFENVMQN